MAYKTPAVLTLTKNGWICNLCGRSIARPTTSEGSAKGLFAMHKKWRHG